MINLFCGFDAREAVGFHVFCHSVIKRATAPVRITPLSSLGLPQGSNTFTTSRFLVPYLMGFEGRAIFMDACDMLMLGDVAELDALFDERYAVQVVKHADYVSSHDRKYIGTEMECAQSNYNRKNWASAVLWNCDHRSNWYGPQAIANANPVDLLQFAGYEDDQIGNLPPEWNVLIDEGREREGAKLLHWTVGIPTFKHYRNARASTEWFAELDEMTGGAQHG